VRDASAEPAASDPIRRDVRRIGLLMLPRIVGLGAVQLNFIVNTNLASNMGTGAVSALNIAFAVMILPQAAIAQAIATVLFPSISAHAARGESAEYGAMVTRAVNVVLGLSVPAAFGLILLGQPLIQLLFERGAFGPEATQAVAFTLAWFAVGLAGHSVLEVVTRGFYALQDTLRPVVLGVVSMGINVILSLVLSAAFRAAGLYPFGGLALANSIATAFETVILLALLARRQPAVAVGRIAVASVKSLLAALGMAAVLAGWLILAGTGAIATLLAIPLGVASYVCFAYLLGSQEVRYMLSVVRSRVMGIRVPST
jgi:putative peptidoglycan lipid II flippase